MSEDYLGKYKPELYDLYKKHLNEVTPIYAFEDNKGPVLLIKLLAYMKLEQALILSILYDATKTIEDGIGGGFRVESLICGGDVLLVTCLTSLNSVSRIESKDLMKIRNYLIHNNFIEVFYHTESKDPWHGNQFIKVNTEEVEKYLGELSDSNNLKVKRPYTFRMEKNDIIYEDNSGVRPERVNMFG